MGRINYGWNMKDEKGAVNGIRLTDRYHFGWENRSLNMENLHLLEYTKGEVSWKGRPLFLRGYLHIDGEPTDTFILPENFEKGFILVNGFNIGRYYNSAGPQKTLYVPAPLLKKGRNEIVIFETDSVNEPSVVFTDTPILK